jgi:hypothetical protein
VPRPLVLTLVVASRFGLLLGLALWLGLATALLLGLPVLRRSLPAPHAAEAVASLMRRLEQVLFLAVTLVWVALTARVVLDRAAPPTSLILPVAIMTCARLLAALAVSPAIRALRARMRDANAPATDAERSAFGRLDGARSLLVTLEVCLALYALFAVS